MIEYENLNRSNTSFCSDYKKSFEDFLESGWYILGKRVEEFEKSYADFCGTNFCVGVANGLDAMTISLSSFNFEKGSEVIVPSNTYIATILSVLHSGLMPVLVEPEINTYNIDPEKIEASISSKTKAILVVHLYGKMCAMDRIKDIAVKYNLRIIEDCAQAHGAKYKGQCAGSFGDFGAHSFYPTKNLGALGDGGAITCSDELLAERVKTLRNYGSRVKYYNEVVGYNSRLDEVQAAFLTIKLRQLDTINEHKRNLANFYQLNLSDNFIKPQVHPDYHDVYHIYNIRHPRRDVLKEYLLNKGIKTEIHYPIPPHEQPAMQGLVRGAYPISEEIHKSTLSLPISYGHTQDDIHRVTEVMNNF